MKNLLWFTLVGALLLVAVAEEFDEIEGDEDDLVNEEEFYGSGTGPSLMQCLRDKWQCIKDNNNWRHCIKNFKQCVLEVTRPHVQQCHEDKKQCYEDAKGWVAKLKCKLAFTKCLLNRPN